jgi:hypothetical protein
MRKGRGNGKKASKDDERHMDTLSHHDANHIVVSIKAALRLTAVK